MEILKHDPVAILGCLLKPCADKLLKAGSESEVLQLYPTVAGCLFLVEVGHDLEDINAVRHEEEHWRAYS